MSKKEDNLKFLEMFSSPSKTKELQSQPQPKSETEEQLVAEQEKKEPVLLFTDPENYLDYMLGEMPEDPKDWIINQ